MKIIKALLKDTLVQKFGQYGILVNIEMLPKPQNFKGFKI